MSHNAVNTIIVFFILLLSGFFLSKGGILDEKTSRKLTQLVLLVCIPAMMLVNIVTYFEPESFKNAGAALLVPIAAGYVCWGVSMGFAKLLRVREQSRGVFAAACASPNTVFVGLPVCQALFGPQASLPALFYFLGNTLTFWTAGVWGIRRDTGVRAPFFSKQTLKALLSPSLIAMLVSLAILLLRIPIPSAVMLAAGKLSGAGTPLAMMVAGGVIERGLKNGIFRRREIAAVMLGKVVLLPAITYALTRLFGLSGITQQVLVAQAAMPLMSQITIVAQSSGADDELASAASALSMLSLFAVMPILSAMFG